MPSKKFYILSIIIIAIALLYISSLFDGKMEDKDLNKKKTIAIEVINPSKNKIINFDTNRIKINQNLNTVTGTEKLTETKEPEQTEEVKKPKPFLCPTPKKEYDDMWLFNVGQDISLPDTSYVPKDLKKIPSTYSARINICLTKEALDYLEAMLSQATTDGYSIKVTSAFRTFDYQSGLLRTALEGGNPDAGTSIAKPGYSEHQLGTAVDLSGLSINFSSADKAFNDTEEAKWLEKYASDYGFIESYPENKTDITGYIYEPWHYRYVGKDIAKQIIKKGETLSEFLKDLIKKTGT